MSTDRVTYVMYGVKVKYDLDLSNWYYTEFDYKSDNAEFVMDGMSGEYMVFGKILAVFRDFKGEPFCEIDIDSLKQIEIEYKEKFATTFPGYDHYMNNRFMLLAFDHYR